MNHETVKYVFHTVGLYNEKLSAESDEKCSMLMTLINLLIYLSLTFQLYHGCQFT